MDDYESVLFICRLVHIYKIPPRTTAQGYRAAEWGDMGEPLWKGRLRVLEQGSGIPSKAFLRLEDENSGELFALCPYQPSKANPNGGVEQVLDSSRYFVLTVVDPESGSKAYLGMGFPERSESFDFNVALQDWAKRQSPTPLASSSSAASPHLPATGHRDYSLKPGEVLTINIGGNSTKKKVAPRAPATGGGAFLLAPPPPPPSRR